ncbi:unnamed protein product [Cylicocyclus nassatus]|uniref:Uncharacterized protein n=1 Tax=Cylicocyclus nassatus TaxID=53992 RepID=A0AA36DRQ0_CYLNA|nr:unnamed protein product [Cylicocyclus nassatus]
MFNNKTFLNRFPPTTLIQSSRPSNFYKSQPTTTVSKDLPESTVDFLIRFVLDAFGLPDKELLQFAQECDKGVIEPAQDI